MRTGMRTAMRTGMRMAMGTARQLGACIAALALAVAMTSAQDAPQVSSTPQAGFTLKLNGELVLTNVVARDAKTGDPVRGLKPSDFRIYEDGKLQHIDTFDWESVDMATPLNEATVSGLAAGPSAANASKAVVVAKPEELRNHRLIVMFFDLTSMQPEDLDRCVDAAQEFLRTKMQPADLVALVSLGDTLTVDQDFTADKAAMIREVGAYNGTQGQGLVPPQRRFGPPLAHPQQAAAMLVNLIDHRQEVGRPQTMPPMYLIDAQRLHAL